MRKRLPAWILEGLEKAEKEKMKKQEKEEELRKREEYEKQRRKDREARGLGKFVRLKANHINKNHAIALRIHRMKVTEKRRNS